MGTVTPYETRTGRRWRVRYRTPEHRLSHDVVIRFAQAAATYMQATLLMVLAYCGLRWAEATGLRVRDVSMKRRRLEINHTATEVDGNVVEGVPKSWERRSVPFPDFLSEPLARLCAGKGLDDLVFAHRCGGFLCRPSASKNKRSWFLAALAGAGLERLTPHDLRHTAASLAVSSGANVKAVQRMLGHKSAAMTLDTYADLFDDDLDEVAMRLNDGGHEKSVGTESRIGRLRKEQRPRLPRNHADLGAFVNSGNGGEWGVWVHDIGDS